MESAKKLSKSSTFSARNENSSVKDESLENSKKKTIPKKSSKPFLYSPKPKKSATMSNNSAKKESEIEQSSNESISNSIAVFYQQDKRFDVF